MGLVPEGVSDIAMIMGIVELVLEGVDDVAWITGMDGHRRTCSRRCHRCSSMTT